MNHADVIQAAIEPIVEEIVALEKRLENITLTPGPKGEDGKDGKDGVSLSLLDVAHTLIEVHGDKLKGKDGVDGKNGVDGKDGKDGKDGLDAKEADRSVLMDLLIEHSELFVGKTGDPGQDGKDGRDGEKGSDGINGKDANPEDVAAVIKADPEFIEKVKGLPGQDGKDGRDGKDGINGRDAESPDPLTISQIIVDAYSDELRGMPGKDGIDGAGINCAQYVNGAIYREGSTVTAYLGQYYRAKRDTYDQPGDSDAWERIGSSGFRYTGAFEKEKVYKDGDIFIKDFGAFTVVDGNPVIFCGRGAKGERGAVGPSGKPGLNGKDGSTITACEVNGFKAVFVQQYFDGSIDHLEMDFTSAFTAKIEQQAAEIEELRKQLAEIKSLIAKD